MEFTNEKFENGKHFEFIKTKFVGNGRIFYKRNLTIKKKKLPSFPSNFFGQLD